MTAKRIVVFTVCLLALSCKGGQQGDAITFKLAQPTGQKSVYSLRSDMRVDAASVEQDRGSQSSEVALTGMIETEVTSSQPDGKWTLAMKFTDLDMTVNQENLAEITGDLVGKSFDVTMDKDGKVLAVSGIEEAVPGMDLKQLMSQLSPTMQLPNRPVRVGESWPIEIVTPIDAQGAKLNQVLKGTGTLKEVTDGQALIEFDYTIDTAMTDPGSTQMSMSGKGTGKATTRYDLERARFVTNRTDMNMETSGRVNAGGRSEQVRNSFVSSMQMDLINK
jgi:hypothetical protein